MPHSNSTLKCIHKSEHKCPHKNICTNGDSSTIHKINKMWPIHTVEYYSAIKRNGVLMCATTWMDLENIMSSELSQPQNTT